MNVHDPTLICWCSCYYIGGWGRVFVCLSDINNLLNIPPSRGLQLTPSQPGGEITQGVN